MTQMPEPAGQIPAWTLGWRMQRSLAHAELTVETIAGEMGVSRSTVSRWLNDRGAPPKAAYIKLWALRCGVPYEWLAGTGPFEARDAKGQVSGGFRTARSITSRTFRLAA